MLQAHYDGVKMTIHMLRPEKPENDSIRPRIPSSDGAQDDASLMPSDAEVLDCLVANNGILMRVAGKLGISELQVLQCVTRNAAALSTKLRATMMVNMFQTALAMNAAMLGRINEMSADTLGRSYGSTLTSFTQLAAQFEETVEEDTDDDASVAKQQMLDRIGSMAQRERDSSLNDVESSVS